MTPPGLLQSEKRGLNRPALRRAVEVAVRVAVTAAGWTAIVILGAIALFLLVNAYRAIDELGLVSMLTGKDWYPTSDPPKVGFLPLLNGSLLVTGIALGVCVPVGIATAIYISEFSSSRIKEIMKSVVEFLAAVPSVVYGLLGVAMLVPNIKTYFEIPTGMTALTGGLVLGLMSLPTVISISEDALHAVPRDLRQGSAALGNTTWQTAYKVVIPSASSGIFAAVMLGLGRAIGETIAVLMLVGNSARMTLSPLEPVRTMTATIAAEMGEVVQGGLHYSVLFAIGLVLFAITFAINMAADAVLEKQRKRWRR